METNKPSKSGKYLTTETWDALKKSGVTEQELLADQPFGPMIFSYTRAEAIADGVLVDLRCDGEMAKLVREAGFKAPIAMTATAFQAVILAGTVPGSAKGGFLTFPSGQSCKGRLWDVLMILRHAIRKNSRPDSDRIEFDVEVDTNGDGKHETVNLYCHCGPGDDAELVLTVMLIGED